MLNTTLAAYARAIKAHMQKHNVVTFEQEDCDSVTVKELRDYDFVAINAANELVTIHYCDVVHGVEMMYDINDKEVLQYFEDVYWELEEDMLSD